MAYTPPSGINLQHLLQLIAQFRQPSAPQASQGGIGGIVASLGRQFQTEAPGGQYELMGQHGVSASQRTMPAAVLFAHGPGNRQAAAAEYAPAPINAGAVAAGKAEPIYGGPPVATQTGGSISPLLAALSRIKGGRLA